MAACRRPKPSWLGRCRVALEAEALDAREDAEWGRDRRGDELPAWVADKQARLEKIRHAKAALEAEGPGERGGRAPGRPINYPFARYPSRQDPAQFYGSREPDHEDDGRLRAGLQRAGGGGCGEPDHRGSPGDGGGQTTNSNSPMVALIKQQTGLQARELSADAGYCSEANLRELSRRHIKGYVATGRQRHGQASAGGSRQATVGTRTRAMQVKLRRGGHRSRYRLRKQTVEPSSARSNRRAGFGRCCCAGSRR